MIAARNALPLGHSNYTAGLGVLMLPGFCAAALRRRGAARAVPAAGAVLALALLFTSGSRAGMIALLVIAALGAAAAPLRRTTKLKLALGALAAGIAFTAANPRTRAMLRPSDPSAPPNISNVQRSAMLRAGERMGLDRPLLGWGPGTTPLAFPRYRAGLSGGAEDVVQLHSLPVQLWAEYGAAGVMAALAAAVLLLRGAPADPAAAITLAGYAVFAAFDFQLDVPVFGFTVAALAALLAGPPAPARRRWAAGAAAAVALAAVILGGRRDRAPELNAAALSDEAGRHDAAKAEALLRESLALNPDQEIAHFNLGWLLVVDDPAAAAKHFAAAAHLVPDKGGVYFGLGLARLNAGQPSAAAAMFALEALNDPAFLLSPWWEQPQLKAVQSSTIAQLQNDLSRAISALPAGSWEQREAQYVRAFSDWAAGAAPAAAAAAAANTPERQAWFASHPDRSALAQIPAESLNHERTGYPVLMRNLDLPPPIDLWLVRQSGIRGSPLAFLVPDKGWLPSPLLIALLDGRELRKP